MQRPAAILDPAAGVPVTANSFANGETNTVPLKLNQNSARLDLAGRFGGGGYAIATGLVLSAGAGLVLNISAGQAQLDGVVPYYGGAITLTDNTTRTWVWITRTGAITPVLNSTTPPAGACCLLGSVVTASGAITQIDGSGVLTILGGTLCRATGDTTAPTDTPPADQQFLNCGVNGTRYWWDGTAYKPFYDPFAGYPTSTSFGQSFTIPAGYQLVLEELNAGGDLNVLGTLKILGP